MDDIRRDSREKRKEEKKLERWRIDKMEKERYLCIDSSLDTTNERINNKGNIVSEWQTHFPRLVFLSNDKNRHEMNKEEEKKKGIEMELLCVLTDTDWPRDVAGFRLCCLVYCATTSREERDEKTKIKELKNRAKNVEDRLVMCVCVCVHKYQPAYFMNILLPRNSTATAWWLYWFAGRSDIHTWCWFSTRCCWRDRWHARLDFLGHCHKCIFDIGGILRWCFQEGNTQGIRIFLQRDDLSFTIVAVDRGVTFAFVYSTARLAVKSHLFPTNNLFTFSLA